MRTTSGAVFDVLMATDLRFPGGTTASIAEEVHAQVRAGYRTALLHLPSPIQRPDVGFAPRIRSLIDAGLVDLILEGPVHAKVLVVRHPSVLTAIPDWLPQVTADKVVVVANQVPVDPRAHGPYYDVLANHRTAQRFSRAEPVWAPIGPAVRDALATYADRVPMFDQDWTNIVDVDAWYSPREEGPGQRPVIGRHTRGHWSKWPADRETLLAAYPEHPGYTVRVLGGTEAPRDILGYLPTNWVDLPFNTVRPADFLAAVDFVVYYHHPTLIEAFGRTVLEGAASGAVTIVDPLFEPTFGAACLYATPQQVRGLVDELSADRDAYRRQSDQAVAAVRSRFGYEAHAARLDHIIGPPSLPPQTRAAAGEPRGAGAERRLVVDPGERGPAADLELVELDQGGAPPVLLIPAARADVFGENAVVETIPAVTGELSQRDRLQYLRARVRGILAAYPGITQVVEIGTTTSLAGIVPPSVQLVLAAPAGSSRTGAPRWQLTAPDGSEPARIRAGRGPRDLVQRGINLVRQHAPRPVIRLGLIAKRGSRRLRHSAFGRLAPHGVLIAQRSQLPRLPTPVTSVTADRPAGLFVVTDPGLDAEQTIRAIVQRATVSNAFRPVLLAPASWITAAARARVAVETLHPRGGDAAAYTPQWSGYLRRRTAEVVQAFQPAFAATIRCDPDASSTSLTEALDVAEELSTQRTASGGTG